MIEEKTKNGIKGLLILGIPSFLISLIVVLRVSFYSYVAISLLLPVLLSCLIGYLVGSSIREWNVWLSFLLPLIINFLWNIQAILRMGISFSDSINSLLFQPVINGLIGLVIFYILKKVWR